jgi:hypothetical protein
MSGDCVRRLEDNDQIDATNRQSALAKSKSGSKNNGSSMHRRHRMKRYVLFVCSLILLPLDFALAEMWGGKLERTGTLAEGKEHCDFYFKFLS